jgi:alpha-aminoadipic semialdehyde synthase
MRTPIRIAAHLAERSVVSPGQRLFVLTRNEQIAPYLTTLINGAGWQTGYPRIMKREDVDTLPVGPNGPKLVAIQDVTCDLEVGFLLLPASIEYR